MKLAVMQAYDPEINKLNTIIREKRTAFNIAEAFKDVSESIVFLQQMQEFREKLKLIKETRLPCLTVEISSTIKDFDTTHWEQFKLADVDKLSLPQEKSNARRVISLLFSPTFILTALFGLLILGTMQMCYMDVVIDTLQYWKTLVLALSSCYLADTAEIADHAAFYWEKMTDSAFVLSEKCANYAQVILDNVAQFVYKKRVFQ